MLGSRSNRKVRVIDTFWKPLPLPMHFENQICQREQLYPLRDEIQVEYRERVGGIDPAGMGEEIQIKIGWN